MDLVLLFLDDDRICPTGWRHFKNPRDMINFMKQIQATAISLDHDLGIFENGREVDGYSVLLWLESEIVMDPNYPCPQIFVHTSNAAARDRMVAAVRSINRRKGNPFGEYRITWSYPEEVPIFVTLPVGAVEF